MMQQPEQTAAPFTVEELSREWANLLTAQITARLSLEKQNRAMAARIEYLEKQLTALRSDNRVPDEAREIAERARVIIEDGK